MSHLNAKSRLQELAHKKGEKLPKYETKAQGAGFISTVYTCGFRYDGVETSTKKEAEQQAAIAALNVLQQISYLEYIPGVSRRVHLFIDGENMHNHEKELEEYLHLVLVDVFVSKNALVIRDGYHVIPTIIRDGADVGMSMYIGSYVDKHPDEVYLILTKDHFGAAIVHILEHIPVEAHHCVTYHSAIRFIKQYLTVE